MEGPDAAPPFSIGKLAMIYCEYIARDRSIPLEVFRHHGRQDWTGEGDRMVANLARTMKMAGEPHYMCWWKIAAINRMDEWEAHFRTPEGRDYAAHSPVPRAMNFYQAGLYDEIYEGEIGAGLLHYVEFFNPSGMAGRDLAEAFLRRQDGAATLAYVITRLGLLGPDPGGIAIYSFAGYQSAEPFLRRGRDSHGIAVHSAGLYRTFGEDIA